MPVLRKFVVPALTSAFAFALTLLTLAAQPARGEVEGPATASRVISRINNAEVVKLPGNTHPSARPEFDQGLLDPNKVLEKLVLILKRSPEQEQALAAFNERQLDPKSPDFHHWIQAEEFGEMYGPSEGDMATVTDWLQNQGFQIDLVTKGRVSIQFTGTVGQVQDAFHLEMHKYLVDGKQHISNDRDPSIPVALAPVVTGLASLNDFRPTHYSHPGNYVKRDLKTGKYTPMPQPFTEGGFGSKEGPFNSKGKTKNGIQPEFGYVDASTGYQREELSPYDVATIYNVLPLWNESTPINGKGVKVAIVALSDVETSDFNTFRKSFGLPAGTLTTVHSGSDPGITDSQGENTEDTEMVSATAPGAEIVLVADVDNSTTNGLVTALTYIAENNIAPILTMSYGTCELMNGTSDNSLYNKTFQQAATAGISSFVASGDSGSATCTRQSGTPPYGDQYGLAVSGMASNPYVTAVGGTDVQWYLQENTTKPSVYWNSTNDANGASAKGYMPEMSWNDTCTNPLLLNVFSETSNEELCNDSINGDPGLVEMASGGGGKSACTTPSGTTPSSCSGGYTKPSWQTGVSGIPADGKRDLPDVSFFAAYGFQDSTGIPGSALLICQASASPENSCDYSDPNYIIYQENGGTSAASPLTAGIMALVLQKQGGAAQGLANPVFYQLAAKETYADCNSNTVKAGNSCIFYDTTTGSNAMNCYTGDPNCVTNTSGDQSGILSGYKATTGYDLTTGLGTFNVANLVNAWPSTTTTPTVTLTPASMTFASTKVGSTATTQTATLKNTGTVSATIAEIEITGTNDTSYSATTTCGSTLAAGASCTATVSFKPTTTGTLTAALNFLIDGISTARTVSLTGTGAAATAPAVTLTPTSEAFGSEAVGSTTASKTVTLKNSGTATLDISSIAVGGTNASSFTIPSKTCTTTLAAGSSCTFTVAFKPAAAGSLTGDIAITDNAPASPQTVTLSGTGAAATAPAVTLSPTSEAFASTTVGSTAASKTVTLKNSGTATLDISSIAVGGTNASSFTIPSKTCTTTLAAGSSCTFTVAFKPAAAGSLTGDIAITDNAPASPQKVTLTGTGTAAATTGLALSPTSLTFSSTAVGSTSEAQSETLTNNGAATVTIKSITLTSTNETSFTELSACGTTLASKASCTVVVSFKPTTSGSLKAALSISSTATTTTQTVALSGTATAAPTMKLSATSIAFAATAHGTTSEAKVVTLTNSGTSTATIDDIVMSGANPSDFEELDTCGATLAGGASCSIYVSFKPGAASSYTASVLIYDNATASPQTITLSGTGD